MTKKRENKKPCDRCSATCYDDLCHRCKKTVGIYKKKSKKRNGRMYHHPEPKGYIRDGIFIPKKMRSKDAAEYIFKIADYKGSHVLKEDALDWAELRLLTIAKICKKFIIKQ